MHTYVRAHTHTHARARALAPHVHADTCTRHARAASSLGIGRSVCHLSLSRPSVFRLSGCPSFRLSVCMYVRMSLRFTDMNKLICTQTREDAPAPAHTQTSARALAERERILHCIKAKMVLFPHIFTVSKTCVSLHWWFLTLILRC